MTWFVVVTRDRARTPIKRCVTLGAAGDYIFRERCFDLWTVMAQHGDARGPLRELTKAQRCALERHLYPSLFE